MSTNFDQAIWLQKRESSAHSRKPSMNSFFEEYQTMNIEHRLPQPDDNFDPYLEGYQEVDDLLTQTLNSLQDLDIPVGIHYPEQLHQRQQNFKKGHEKKQSGTAIFGFAQHDKNLSIGGMSVAPSEIYNEKPMVFETVSELEKHINNKKSPSPNDYIIKSNTPGEYKFPNSSSSSLSIPASRQSTSTQTTCSPQKSTRTVEVPVEYLQKLKSMIKNSDGIDMESLLGYEFGEDKKQTPESSSSSREPTPQFDIPSAPPHEHSASNSLKSSQHQMVSAPQPSTSTIGLGLKYDDPYMPQHQSILSPPEQTPMPPPPPTTYEMPLYAQQQHGFVSYPMAVQFHHHQRQPQTQQLSHQLQPHLQPPPTPQISHQQLHYRHEQLPLLQTTSTVKPQTQIIQKSHIPQQLDSTESEFTAGPKTPSPTLRSQAHFDSAEHFNTSPRKPGLSWTPIKDSKSLAMSEGRKPHDKVSTLPPGEIDLYIIGPGLEKIYTCNYESCGKTFTRRYNARSHVQTHLSDRPFICDFENCTKSFVRHHDLTRHKKVHTEFAHKCPCGKRFARQDALFKHRTRNICSGALSEDEIASMSHVQLPPPSRSITKPKKSSSTAPIKVENDKVAKRLEFDILNKAQRKTQSVPERFDDDQENIFYDMSFNDEFVSEF